MTVGDETAHTGIETINITIPRNVLTRAIGSARRRAGLTIGADQHINLIIGNLSSGLIANGRLLDIAMAARMAGIGLDLLAAGLAERLALEPKRSAGAVSLIYRAETFIESISGTTI